MCRQGLRRAQVGLLLGTTMVSTRASIDVYDWAVQ